MTTDATLALRSPADIVAAVPYLLGFHPSDSLTVVALRGNQVMFAARHDLPDPDTVDTDFQAEARHVATIVARQDADSATVIGYGPATRVTPAVTVLADALRRAGVTVIDELRVTDGRFWSYRCQELSCCPPEGTVYDTSTSAVAAAATYAGQVALPDRQALADQVAPVIGAERDAMTAATARALRRLAALPAPALSEAALAAPVLSEAALPTPALSEGAASTRAVRRAGRVAVRAAVRRHRTGGRLTDDEVAWLGVLMTHLPARDDAWARTDGSDERIRLWTDVARRVQPAYVPAPACLLAYAAWRSGHGALASVAVERALAQDPVYSMAVLLDDVLRHGLSPSALDDDPERDSRASRSHRGSRSPNGSRPPRSPWSHHSAS